MENPCKDVTTSIMNLPDDCLLLICQGLESGTDRDSFGLTCRRWLHIQNSSRRSLQFNCSLTSFNQTPLSQTSPNINSFHVYKLLTRFQLLNVLSLSGCTELSDLGIGHLQFFGSNIQTLYLDCCFMISDIGLSVMASGCPCLTSISLYRCSVTDIGLESLAKSCPSLQNVNLSYCTNLFDNGIKFLSQECRQLRSVIISYCKNVTGTGFNGCSETLAYVEADSCKLEPDGISGIVSGGGLEYLNLSSLCWSILGDGLVRIGEGFAMKLRVLNLRMCRSASNEAVMTISKGCPELQEWSLALCHEIKLHGWEAIGLNCRNLRILHVNRCRNLCDRGFQALRDRCNRLSVLYMNRCPRISHLAIELFKCRRADVEIREEELVCIGPNSIFR